MATKAPTNLGAISSGGGFEGLLASDFDSYLEKKWASNAYTLERRRAKDKMLGLARAIQEELTEDMSGLELGASEEQPSVANGRKVQAQWIFLTRSAEERAGLKSLLHRTDLQAGASLFDISIQHQHACLVLRLDAYGLGFGVELAGKASVDRENLAEKLKNAWACEKFAELAHALPGGACLRLGSMELSAIDATADTVRSLIDPLLTGQEVFSVDVTVSRDDESLSSGDFVGTAVDHVSRVLPIFRFLAWSHDNNFTQVKEAIQKEREDRQKRPVAFTAGDRVIILSGLFSGRAGYLAEIDPKGKAKVMVGPVSVSVNVKDLKGS